MEDEGRLAVSSDFGRLLRRLRLAAGLSQEALAERARMSTNGIGALERGYRHTPHHETVTLLATALVLEDEQRREFEESARSGTPRRLLRSSSADPWRDSKTSNLPRSLTSFVGRERDVFKVKELLRSTACSRSLAREVSAKHVSRSRLAKNCSIAIPMAFGSST